MQVDIKVSKYWGLYWVGVVLIATAFFIDSHSAGPPLAFMGIGFLLNALVIGIGQMT